jgi:hypothetical protein
MRQGRGFVDCIDAQIAFGKEIQCKRMDAHKGTVSVGPIFCKSTISVGLAQLKVIGNRYTACIADIKKFTGWGIFVVVVPSSEFLHNFIPIKMAARQTITYVTSSIKLAAEQVL